MYNTGRSGKEEQRNAYNNIIILIMFDHSNGERGLKQLLLSTFILKINDIFMTVKLSPPRVGGWAIWRFYEQNSFIKKAKLMLFSYIIQLILKGRIFIL
jgi:hypothetical protein